jgi:RNA 3'-terminal phosphate cyclase (ATP)
MDWLTTRDRDTQTGKRWTTHHGHAPMGYRDVGPGPHARDPRAPGRPAEVPRWITIDCSGHEDQVLRSALTLSLVTGVPFLFVSERDCLGLRPEHLKAIEVAAILGTAEVTGASLGSPDFTFRPGTYTPTDLAFEIGPDASPAGLLQMLHLPIALRSSSPIRLTLEVEPSAIETHAHPFLEPACRARLAALGAPIAVRIDRSRGRLDAWIEPARLRPLPFAESADLDADFVEQILIPLALAPGRGEFRVSKVTESLRALAWTVHAFLPRRNVRIEVDVNGAAAVVVEDRT